MGHDQIRQDSACLFKVGIADFGQSQPSCRSIQQTRTEMSLQFGKRTRDHGRCHIQRTGRAGGLGARQDGADSALLAMQQTPESVGALIYRGALFKLNQPEKDAVFSYERRVNDTPTGLSATLFLPGRHCTALTSATRHTRTASIRFPSRRAAF